MAIILLRRKAGLNVLLGVTFATIIVLLLVIVNAVGTRYLGDYLIKQRRSNQTSALNNCALEISPYLTDIDIDSVYNIMNEYALNENGRLLLIDESGIVQIDTFLSLNGTRPELEEVALVLSEKKDQAYGFHKHKLTETISNNSYFPKNTTEYWAVYYAQQVYVGGKAKAVLLLSSPIQDVVNEVNSVIGTLTFISISIGVLAMVFTFYTTNKITLSIRKLNRAITKMSTGDFSVRLNESEFGEFSDVSKGFNIMCRKLEDLDDSRNRFVSDASHELKTPLASMKILSDALLSQDTASEALYREFMTDINHEIDRLTMVINDLLALVKMDGGSSSLMMIPVQLGGLVDMIITSVSPLAKNKNITITYEYKDVTAVVDQLRMQQVITNLLDNAIKYSPNDTTITVELNETASNAIIKVSDQGIGIAEENLPRLFERFYRVDKARSRSTGGTGLGLSIVNQIVKQHGGTISVESKLNEGSTFTVTIPLSGNKQETDENEK